MTETDLIYIDETQSFTSVSLGVELAGFGKFKSHTYILFVLWQIFVEIICLYIPIILEEWGGGWVGG